MKERENFAGHKKYIFFILLIFQTVTFAQNVQQAWVSEYGQSPADYNEVADIAVDNLGNVYVTGYSSVSTIANEYATIKYNAAGDAQWVRRYKGPAELQDMAYAIAVDNSGNVYVTGESTGLGTGQDYATVKYNSSGTVAWVARYNGLGNSIDVATDIALDDSGNVYVTGGSQGAGTGRDYATVKYNASGVEQWVVYYNGNGLAGYDVASTICVDDSGNVYVTGESQGIGTGRDYATVKYNASGTEMWIGRYNGFSNYFDTAADIAVDDSGNVYVAGYSSGPNGNLVTDYATIKYNFSGTELWVRRYNGPGNAEDICTSLAIDGAGNVFVTGLVTAGVDMYPIATVKYSTTGTEEWVALFNGMFSAEMGEDIATDTSGNVYVTGYTAVVPYSLNDYVTIKYSNSGMEEWVIRYDRPDHFSDQAKAIAVDVNGNVYITGFSYGNYATIKYVQGSAPIGPTNLIAVADTFSVDLYWDDNSDNELGFKIERKDDSLHIWAPWFLIDSVGANVTAYTDSGLTPNTVYSYRVYAYNEFGNSDYSDSIETVTIIPVELTSFTASINEGKVILNWTTATELNNQGFQIERKSVNSSYEQIGYVPGFGTTTEPKAYSFTDSKITNGKYTYRLKQIDFDGSYSYSKVVEIDAGTTPKEFALYQNYPNPFNPSTTINFSLAVDSQVSLKIFNVLGQEVARLINGQMAAGNQKVSFDASSLSSDVYFYRIEADGADGQKFSSVKKMILTK